MKITCKESEIIKNKSGKKPGEQLIQQLWNIFSQSPIPTLISNKDGQFVKYNDAMVKLTGYTHYELPDVEKWLQNIYPDKEYQEYVRNKVQNCPVKI